MFALLKTYSWQELRHHPWRTAAAVVAVMLGVALAFSVQLINASALAVNPRKLADKRYYRHSGYPGGIKSETMEHLLARNPERVVRLAVKGMLPKGPLGRQMLKRLRVYPGAQHPHIAQNPQPRALTSARAR